MPEDASSDRAAHESAERVLREDAECIASEDAKRAVRDRLATVLADVAFPVHDQLAVAAAVDAPHSERVHVGDRRFTAMELAVRLEPYQDFPYDSVDELVDDVIDGLDAEELL